MKMGIIGLPGSGKSSLFDLLTESYEAPDHAQAHNKPRIRSVKVHDARLERLRDDYAPRKYTPASFELYDFPAPSSSTSRSGLADLLAPARELDSLFIVLNAFGDRSDKGHDVKSDMEEVWGELIIADLVIVEKRVDRLDQKRRKPSFSKDDARELELLERVKPSLEENNGVASLGLSQEEATRLGGFGFLSAKPTVVVVNTDENSRHLDVDTLRTIGEAPVVVSSLRNELEILQLPAEEQAVFLQEYGIAELSRDRLISEGYRVAGRISFFTAGDKEVRAWTIMRGETALEAAGTIHTDMARGFIRAETLAYEDYLSCGSVKKAREKGVLRLEGKEYVIQDGDIVEFRFSV